MRRVTFKKYAGVRINGDIPVDIPGDGHMDRASWLTVMVESGGKFGTVISYDGTGMTAGLHQAIAVYPRELLLSDDGNNLDDQGPLWKLLDRCFQATPHIQATVDLKEAFGKIHWTVVNGVLRDSDTGRAISGKVIREELTGAANGCMPVRGIDRKQAEMWAALFHTYFSDVNTFSVQEGWGKEKLIKRVERTPLRYASAPKWRKKTPQDFFYEDLVAGVVDHEDLEPEFDLAMSVWLSYTVNAPAIALKVLCRYIPTFQHDGIEAFSVQLLKALGKAKFGRWGAHVKNGRYQRTRKYAMEIWPKEMFVGKDAIMPASL